MKRRVRVLAKGIGGAVAVVLCLLAQASVAYAVSVPNPAPQTPPGMEGPVNTMLGWLKWGGMIACMIGIGTGLIQMAVGRRNRHALAVDGASGIPWALSAGVGFGVMSGLIGAIFGG
ncbi:MAG TPA: hypothetical protein VM754_10035 [Actinomycetota bacterium]|nr:hypothetical protein [Actinomycetota bacterium]